LKLLSASSLLEIHLVSVFIVPFSFVIVAFLQPSTFPSLIVSTVQTCHLYCRFDSLLVRLTVTVDSLNLLSLLLLLELLFIALALGEKKLAF